MENRTREEEVLLVDRLPGGRAVFEGRTLDVEPLPPPDRRQGAERAKLRKLLSAVERYVGLGILPAGTRPGERMANVRDEGAHRCFVEVLLPDGISRFLELSSRHVGDERPASVDVVHGVCFFGHGHATGISASGRRFELACGGDEITEPLEEVVIDEGLSTYELDAFADLVALVRSVASASPGPPNVVLQLPSLQYYLSLADAYEKGLASPSAFVRFHEAIDRRKVAFERAYGEALSATGAAIEIVDTTVELETYVGGRAALGQPVTLARGLEILRGYRPDLARAVDEAKVGAWRDLLYLTYPWDFVQRGLARDASGAPRALVQVDAFAESKILGKAHSMASAAGNPDDFRMLGVYTLPRVLEPGSFDLYYRSVPLTEETARTVADAYGAAADVEILRRHWERA